jgi:hypothetical protein
MNEYNKCEFSKPSEIEPIYPEIITAYQEAFAGWPWYEVSKCADPLRRCIGGFCKLAVGSFCNDCNNEVIKPAYESNELTMRFESIACSRPTSWYTEKEEKRLTMAAIAWEETPSVIANEKYKDVPDMNIWLESVFGDKKLIWLDEVFANTKLKPKGNLDNFRSMCIGLMNNLDNPILAFRTINPLMIRAAERDFGENVIIFKRETDELPDRRDFVIINMENEIADLAEGK